MSEPETLPTTLLTGFLGSGKTTLLRRALVSPELADTAVIINDVVRDPIHLALVYLSLPLYRSHFTHHDAPASVRRAYTVAEMHQMLRETTAAKVDVERHRLFRMGAIAWKK